jgi:hypothetical protein
MITSIRWNNPMKDQSKTKQSLIQERGRMRQQGKETINSYTFKIIAKDGSEKWVDLSGTSTMLHSLPALSPS